MKERSNKFFFIQAFDKKDIRINKINKLNGIENKNKYHYRLVTQNYNFTNNFLKCKFCKKLETIERRKKQIEKRDSSFKYNINYITRDVFIKIIDNILKNNKSTKHSYDFDIKKNLSLYRKERQFMEDIKKSIKFSYGCSFVGSSYSLKVNKKGYNFGFSNEEESKKKAIEILKNEYNIEMKEKDISFEWDKTL